MGAGYINEKGQFILGQKKYELEYRTAVEGEYIITTPKIINLKTTYRERNIFPYHEPVYVKQSLRNFVMTDYLDLDHGEYYVIRKINRKKVYTGEDVIVKRLLGIPIYRVVIMHYEYID
ncbi:hypothetical protein [Paenibacillus xylanexedens]|uniref:hypothetical protein n=1 Tax=Paenibacillus xylanexedens TaxID=528191 RepID=UPI000F53C387|nr:hypothetical protein [Paenibacillus xylanexedens]